MHTLRNLYQSQASLLAEQHDVRQIFLPGQGEASFDVLFPLFRSQAVLGPGAPVPDQQVFPKVPFLSAPGPEDFFRQVVSSLFLPHRVRRDAGGCQPDFRHQMPVESLFPENPLPPFFRQPGQQVLPSPELGHLQGFLDAPCIVHQEEQSIQVGTIQAEGLEGAGMPDPPPAGIAEDPFPPHFFSAARTGMGVEQGVEQGKDG